MVAPQATNTFVVDKNETMKYTVKITDIKTIDEPKNLWNTAQMRLLLDVFDFAEAAQLQEKELKEYLFLVISEFEPQEAASILLQHYLGEVLNEGQIDNLSHEMLREKVTENHSDISLHKTLFEVNQMLYKAYNGKFPLTKATQINLEIVPVEKTEENLSKAEVLQALHFGLSETNLIIRLFHEALLGKTAFEEADAILWELEKTGTNQYQITTSEKWIENTDFEKQEFEADVHLYIASEEDKES